MNNNSHYKAMVPEPISVIHSWGLNFNIGNVLKYISRYRLKGDEIGDLEKARRYLDYEIEYLKAMKTLGRFEKYTKGDNTYGD